MKSLIGQAAAKLINSGDTVILDSGTTTREIAANLRSVENVVVMTNGLDVAMELASAPGVEVLISGGVLRKSAMSFSGSQAEASLKNFRFDKVFWVLMVLTCELVSPHIMSRKRVLTA